MDLETIGYFLFMEAQDQQKAQEEFTVNEKSISWENIPPQNENKR